ncbi:MAG: hypothetical protein Q9223_001831 [Gallowayella weberi]
MTKTGPTGLAGSKERRRRPINSTILAVRSIVAKGAMRGAEERNLSSDSSSNQWRQVGRRVRQWASASLKLYDQYPPSDALSMEDLRAWYDKMPRNVKLSDWWLFHAHRLLQDTKPPGMDDKKTRADYPADLGCRKVIKAQRKPCGR